MSKSKRLIQDFRLRLQIHDAEETNAFWICSRNWGANPKNNHVESVTYVHETPSQKSEAECSNSLQNLRTLPAIGVQRVRISGQTYCCFGFGCLSVFIHQMISTVDTLKCFRFEHYYPKVRLWFRTMCAICLIEVGICSVLDMHHPCMSCSFA